MTSRTSWWGKRSLWQRFVLLLVVLGIAAGVYFFLNRGPAPQPSIFRIASSGEGEASLVVEGNDPQWSPDGNSVLLTADDEEGVEGIHRLDLDGGEPTFITPGGNPSWSADGATIAFSLEDDQGVSHVYSIPADGGEPTLLTDGDEPVFSPDGAMIAFSGQDQAGNPGVYTFDMASEAVDPALPRQRAFMVAGWVDHRLRP